MRRAKAREPRCRRRARLLAYAGDDLDRKIPGNTGIFAKPPARDAAFTQTLRHVRIAYGFKAGGRLFRARTGGGMEKARSKNRIPSAKKSRESRAGRLARDPRTPPWDFCSDGSNSGSWPFGYRL